MSESAQASPPRRDIWLLPLISLLTLAFLGCVSEATARLAWPEVFATSCTGPDGVRNRNCSFYAKSAEGPMVLYSLNDCGFRSADPCGAKPPGALRLAALGTSVAYGRNIPYDETFPVRAVRTLSRTMKRPVEFENMSSLDLPLQSAIDLIPQALTLQADAIVLAFTPWDFSHFDPGSGRRKAAGNSRPAAHPSESGIKMRLLETATQARLIARSSRALVMIQHYLLQDKSTLLSLYGAFSDRDDPLRERWSEPAKRRFAAFEIFLDRIAEKLGGSQRQFLVMLVPSRIQVALIGSGTKLAGVDPDLLFVKMKRAVEKRGFGFVDVRPQFRRAPHPEDCYYPVDSHPNSQASELLADALVKRLTDGALPAFSTLPEGTKE